MELLTTTQDLYCIQLLKHVKARCLEGQQANRDGKRIFQRISMIVQMSFDKSYNYINCTGFRQLSAIGGKKQKRYPPLLGDKLVDCGIDFALMRLVTPI